jgi:hypothetical protein
MPELSPYLGVAAMFQDLMNNDPKLALAIRPGTPGSEAEPLLRLAVRLGLSPLEREARSQTT